MLNKRELKNWEKLLYFIYENQVKWNYFTRNEYYLNDLDQIKFSKKLKIRPSEIESSFDFLENLNLIKVSKKDPNKKDSEKKYTITKVGLDYAFKIEKREREKKYNQILIIFTFILIFTPLLEFIKLSKEKYSFSIITSFFIILFFILNIIIYTLFFKDK